MKRLNIPIIILLFFICSCSNNSSKESSTSKESSEYPNKYSSSSTTSILNEYSYIAISGEPNEDWVGKFLRIRFDNVGGVSIRGKTKIVQLMDFEKDSEGYKYFTVKDLSDDYLREVFIFWFDNDGGKNGFGPNIKSWQEAIPK